MGYTAEEDKWCKGKQVDIWNYLSTSGHLYSSDPMIVRMYMSPAQDTYPLGSNSPSEVGVWMGMQLIDTYMKKNKEVSIAELLSDIDYRGMLEKAQITY